MVAGANENRLKFYRAFTQNQVELDQKRAMNAIENEYVNKLLKSGVFSDDDKKGKTCIQRPGFGKYDLDTGLNQAQKKVVRNQNSNKNLNEYEKYVFRKQDK